VIRTIIIPYTRFPSAPSQAFPNRHYVDRPALETQIEFQGQKSPQFYSIIDSGADSSVFPSAFGRLVGINISTDKPDLTMGVGGSGTT